MSGVLEQRYAKWSGLKFNIYIYIIYIYIYLYNRVFPLSALQYSASDQGAKYITNKTKFKWQVQLPSTAGQSLSQNAGI